MRLSGSHTFTGRDSGILSAISFFSVLFLLYGVLLSGCKKDEESAGPGKGGGGHPGMMRRGAEATAVRTTEIEIGSLDHRALYVAETRPSRDVRLSAEVAGIVESVQVNLGDRVESGQVLARIRGRVFNQAVLEAKASVSHAEASILRAELDLELAEKERDRARQLQTRGALTRAELDAIEGRFNSAKAVATLARADLEQRRARLERARIDMANTRVIAPFSGAVAERMIDPGALISPGAALFRIVDADSVVVRFSVPESDISRMESGQKVEVEFDAIAGRTVSGRIERISPVLDPGTRTLAVEVLIEGEKEVKPGMFARVTAILETKHEIPIAPAPALVRRQAEGDTEVREGFFLVRNNTAHFIPSEIGIRNRFHVEIINGPEAGDMVVVAGHSELRDGGEVRIVDSGSGRSDPDHSALDLVRTGGMEGT